LSLSFLAGCRGSSLAPGDGGHLPGQADGAPPDNTDAISKPALPVDPGPIGIHFLNNTEYDNTVKDLLGVAASPVDSFPSDDTLDGFDNNADVLGAMVPTRYAQFFLAANALAAQVFASDVLRARIVTCTPATGMEAVCAKEIIRGFGLRAWRRPLAEADVDRLFALFGAAVGAGEDFLGAIQRLVRAMLSSLPFLYHVELDDQPTSLTVHPLTPYELASRLSYLLWRTMPDDRLFTLAASGEIAKTDVLLAEAERMLADPRSGALVRALADNWWGARAVRERQFDPVLFPTWDDDLRDASIAETYLYLSEFLQPGRSFLEFLTADMNFVNARLAQHYGFPAPAGPGFVRVEERNDQRKGYLGLAGFLAASGLPNRTSPTMRGVRVLESVLCSRLPPPPPDVPALLPEQNPSQTVRQYLEQLRSTQPVCGGCHKLMDPIGLGLEGFDAIGKQRTAYPNGQPVDVAGLEFEGKKFSGLLELADMLTKDSRFAACPPKKLFTYALRRVPEMSGDEVALQQLQAEWSRQGSTLRGLVKQIVASGAFRFRRGENN
jgi:hypothetical protein